ncbi:alpha-ketoglutarate-dependent dioxygenase AlkB [Chitinophaga sedimenti]|uniref:alpha-ketoglutarate-dependent dioxygenase AlkB family protein n=1 Tax=Chitinophaga sedimenti TaxID=2033606 RepID=UPI002003E670|nr:alpha-ketoglutarate-dependent dioxygenase AlkB [Chitinophaga sedimenti]MCK7559494.1 alpha-ketoglutarate-dependent dioxygenase AlkB [Chitinophaga sedimenti]
MEKLNLLPFQGEAYLFPQCFSRPESNDYFIRLQQETQWKQEPIKIFGKEVMQPRLTAWYGDTDKSYTYSGITMQPQAWNPVLTAIKSTIEKVAEAQFTSALLNYYRDGQDSMGWHRDNEKQLGVNPVIASVSFGAPRIFKLRHYEKKTPVINIELTHGSLLLMTGATQHYWEHALPKTARVKEGRINLTFRKIIF